jgi:catechol 2,3-dioxygenase-like lactoylglutathione lyase family enzyme
MSPPAVDAADLDMTEVDLDMTSGDLDMTSGDLDMTAGDLDMTSPRPEIGARLDQLCLQSADPERLAVYFTNAFGMGAVPMPEGGWKCHAPHRDLMITSGKPNQIAFFAFAFADDDALAQYRERLAAAGIALGPNPSPRYGAGAFSTKDPDGNVAVFGVHAPDAAPAGDRLPARLQHVVFRSTNPDAMAEFYERKLGFIVSDRVMDEAGGLRACFLRSDHEHHSFAVFRAPENRLDHHSYETRDWTRIRDWADHVATRGVPLCWGVGRHGVGNNVFFMVKDPDDNLVEISAELEICGADRPAGTWPHEQRTLNLWGDAIMRS